MTFNCYSCNIFIKRDEKYLICTLCDNKSHYACTSLSPEELNKTNEKNWKCSNCISLDNTIKTVNNNDIIDLLQSICDGKNSLIDRVTIRNYYE